MTACTVRRPDYPVAEGKNRVVRLSASAERPPRGLLRNAGH